MAGGSPDPRFVSPLPTATSPSPKTSAEDSCRVRVFEPVLPPHRGGTPLCALERYVAFLVGVR